MGGYQPDFSDYEQPNAKKRGKRDKFLAKMKQVVPWQPVLDLIKPIYPKSRAKDDVRPIH